MSKFVEDRPDNMVLRTVFFPPELDSKLKMIAYHSDVSKGDLIRRLIESGLNVSLNSAGSALAKPSARKTTSFVRKAAGKTAAASKRSASSSTSSAKKATKKPAKKITRAHSPTLR